MTDTTDTRARDRRIAERLGWHTFTVQTWFDGVDWRTADPHGIAPDADFQQPVPDFYTNLNATILLIEGNDAFILRWAGNWNCAAQEYGISAWSDNPAAAICDAFEQFMNAQEATDGKTAE